MSAKQNRIFSFPPCWREQLFRLFQEISSFVTIANWKANTTSLASLRGELHWIFQWPIRARVNNTIHCLSNIDTYISLKTSDNINNNTKM